MMLDEFFTSTIIVSVLVSTIRISTSILLAALGELITEKSGVMNLGVEGTMLMGAFVGFFVSHQSGSLVYGVISAIIAGGLMSLFMAFMTVSLRVGQTVTGLSINLLSAGLTTFFYRVTYGDVGNVPSIVPIGRFPIPILVDIPILGRILFNHSWLTYLAFLLVPLIAILLYKTKYGLAIRAIGENPQAADTRGLNITQYQYCCVVFGGMMAGLGGAFITIGTLSNFMPGIIAGRGWLAIVIVIAGNWHPLGILVATTVFAFLDALQLQMQGIGVPIPHQILLAMPFIIALLVMIGSRARSLAPRHLGEPYIRE